MGDDNKWALISCIPVGEKHEASSTHHLDIAGKSLSVSRATKYKRKKKVHSYRCPRIEEVTENAFLRACK